MLGDPEHHEKPVDTTNKFMVGLRGNQVVVMRQPFIMTKEEALNLAAWLVVVAGGGDEFAAILEAVEST